jgi:hypothetical protein
MHAFRLLIGSMLKTIIFVIAICIFTIVGLIALVVGGVAFLILGRRPRFRVYTKRHSHQGPHGFEQVFQRDVDRPFDSHQQFKDVTPPPRDVTPKIHEISGMDQTSTH